MPIPQSAGADGNDVAQAIWDHAVWDQATWADGSRQTAHLPDATTWAVSARQVVFDGSSIGSEIPGDLVLVGSTALGFGAPRLLSAAAIYPPVVTVAKRASDTVDANMLEELKAEMLVDAEVVPGPQRRHAELVARITTLEAAISELRQSSQLGHNNPPEPVDDVPELTVAQLATMLKAAETLRAQPPAPRAVPEEAVEARHALSQIFMEGLARRGGEVSAEVLAAWAKTCFRGAVWFGLFKVIEGTDIWIELVRLLEAVRTNAAKPRRERDMPRQLQYKCC